MSPFKLGDEFGDEFSCGTASATGNYLATTTINEKSSRLKGERASFAVDARPSLTYCFFRMKIV